MKRLLSFALLMFPLVAHAGGPKLHAASIAKVRTQIYVQFETPVALTDCDVQFAVPKLNLKTGATRSECAAPAVQWTVEIYDASGNPVRVAVVSAIDPLGDFPANGLVTLMLDSAVPDSATRVDVTFNKQNRPHISIEPKGPAGKTVFAPAKTKDDATVYLSGTFSAAVGSTPEYATDSKVNQPLKYFGKNQSSSISAAAMVQTDSKGTADPDGFYWGIPVQHIFERPISVQWSVVGMELDKRGNAVNFVSAPSVTWSLDHAFFRADQKHLGVQTVAASVGLGLTAGVEFGTNLRDNFVAANKPGQTEGAFFRGVPSATAYLIIPQVLHLNKITLSSSYTARIPTTDELFLETRNTKTPIPMLTSQTRNWIQNNLQFNFTEYFGIQIKHQYGSIPPAFSFVQNSGSIGLVFSFKRTNTPPQE
jgi:hypothetical protein